MTEELPLCACGCGEPVTKKGNVWIKGHYVRLYNPMKNPDSVKKLSETTKGIPRPCSLFQCSAMSKARLKVNDPLPDDWEIDKTSKTVTNKNSPQYLGCYIAEQILSNIFDGIRRMPQCNHGYDIICEGGYKIDIKSSATGYTGFWGFNICKNTIADYFLCVAFESREDLIPVYVWLIPGKDINHLTGITINKKKLAKWAKYEQPLDKVIECCNEMRGGN